MKKINEFDLFALRTNITKIIYNQRTRVYTFVGMHNGNERTLAQCYTGWHLHEYIMNEKSDLSNIKIKYNMTTIYTAHFSSIKFYDLQNLINEKLRMLIIVGGRRARLELKK